MSNSSRNCVKFEELKRRPELSDDEIQFCIDHPSHCELGIHGRAPRIRPGHALGKVLTRVGKPRDSV